VSDDKQNKLKARLPRGLGDRGPAEIAATRRMLETIRVVFERYGFEPVETPQIEYTDALGKFLPDQDRPNEGVFSFQDDDEQWLSLRYDLTAPLARYVAENFDALPKPYRSYRFGYVYRNEKPGPGRFRQFMQFDADTVGSASMAADAEVCMMIADTMEELGIPRGSYVVKVNNRKVLDGVMEAAKIPLEKRLIALRAIDKFDRLGAEGTEQLLGAGRKDESGDFTKGAGLDKESIYRLMAYVTTVNPYIIGTEKDDQNPEHLIHQFTDRSGKLQDFVTTNDIILDDLIGEFSDSELAVEGLNELRKIAELCSQSGYDVRRIRIDPSVVRGLEYYTGPVFEVELTFPVEDDDGKPVGFGSVAGGGRYDGLVGRFRGDSVPATGISIGVSRLTAALQHLKKVGTQGEPGPVVVTVFDQDRIADYQRFVKQLRDAPLNLDDPSGPKIRAELYLGSGKLGAQMKYADKRSSPCAIIQGSDEKDNGMVLIKDCFQGLLNAGITDRDEYKAAQAKAQFAVPEDQLVEAVRKLLAQHGVTWN
jgi:histidyl-tRNA synthetase